MTHKPALNAGQLTDSKLGLSGCSEISNVSGLRLQVLQPEHSRTDGVERGPDAVGVVSHDWYSAVCPDAVQSARFFSSLSPE
ncbi:hypothetical protein [Kiloniella majae]|uniref:hypothetical protein n=1 Tax=Kiloniella majae TaxID=1938558 RepID=UPI000A278E9D|nr:hypothetical protein [Kiloniella majae]